MVFESYHELMDRKFDSQDERAWPLTRKRRVPKSILIALMIICLLLARNLWT